MLTITICVGSACHLKGSYEVINALEKLIEDNKLKDKIIIKGSFCLGHCTTGVSVKVNDGPVLSVNTNNIYEFFQEQVKGGGL